MNERWFWRLYRLARIQRAYLKQPGDRAFRNVMSCTHAEIELVSSSNIMFHIKTETDDGFFSPIYRHHDIVSYLKVVTKDYYTFVCKEPEYAHSDQELILKSLQDPKKLEHFIRMGSRWSPGSRLSQFMKTGDPKLIGLDCFPSDEAAIERLREFVLKYASGALHAYAQNSQAKKNHWQTAAANRAMAVESLARVLGLSYMIPHAEYRLLVIDGEHRCFGLYMERAPGEDITQMNAVRRQDVISPSLQRELNRLNMLDTLCCEIDHCPENYHLILQGDRAAGISVFDNNSECNFSILWNVSFETLLKCAPYIDAQGFVRRPFVDTELVAQIRRVSVRDLFLALKPYLAFLPILSLYIRIRRVIRSIDKSLMAGSVCSKGYDEWNEETLQEELRWSHTKTYLHSFLRDCIHV